MSLHIGLDIGSTTVKMAVLDENSNIIHSVYERHFSDVGRTVRNIINDANPKFKDEFVTMAVTGSGGLAVKDFLNIPFVQEVVASVEAVEHFLAHTDVAIELGGEDSKITFFGMNLEQRMNSICAGGTGAFIDQMATLLSTDAKGLNELSKNATQVYPIASRCGVFAKTDIQALMNQGVSKENIAISVFQSVVNQTISNLACGRTIEGNVAFLGGPLHYLDGLRERFIESLNLSPEQALTPENAQLYVAIGAALSSMEFSPVKYSGIFQLANNDYNEIKEEDEKLPPLFSCDKEYEEFKEKHRTEGNGKGDFRTYKGKAYLGIDAGSTTTKMVLLGEDREILYQYYANNFGEPLDVVKEQLIYIYDQKSPELEIASSGVTGYGEDFIRAALKIDIGEVETIAHFTAAKAFSPNVDFILDIGGQDMKAMRIEDGVIQSILLNEACSSGCGSFLETFAKSMGLSVKEFANLAVKSRYPVDLGSRCTVFMNSKVKQVQKEGALLEDIAAGLCYSVIKNALNKVIKIRNYDDMGDNVIVQGGTFLSDGILRAFEKVSGKKAVRPEIAGLMGAYGMAIAAMENAGDFSTIKSKDELESFTYTTTVAQCGRCTNNCKLNIHRFSDGARYITGNRCEKPIEGNKDDYEELPNLYRYKASRVFDYKTHMGTLAKNMSKGIVGIPRVMNMYENYPFWFTLWTELGYEVRLSPVSSRAIYEKGISSITSETLCYPAKLVHGHIESLIEMGCDIIFYPSVFYEEKQFEKADQTINCPVVAGYPDVIRNNMDNLKRANIKYVNPYLSFKNRKLMRLALRKALEKFEIDFSAADLNYAVKMAYEALDKYHEDVYKEGERALEYMDKHNLRGIVLAGRPYHADPEINHGIPEMITKLGFVLLSEDSIAQKTELDGRIRVLDQWNYHSRLYRAAKYVGEHPKLNMVQMNSFGCGIDAITTDEVNEILEAYDKIYTFLKIDEVNNLGAARIRVRSLTEAILKRNSIPKTEIETERIYPQVVPFTAENKKTHTILLPEMAPIHFSILGDALESEGYHVEFLKKIEKSTIDLALKYVNNDACYPTMFVVGQFLEALQSGKYDTNRVSVLMTQTGGACRASNYVGLIRKALKDSGFGHVPVIALSVQGIEGNPGFNLTPSLIKKGLFAVLYGDLLMRLSNASRPYEKIKGSTEVLLSNWIEKLKDDVRDGKYHTFKRNVKDIIFDFKRLEKTDIKKPRAGIVGEILVKFLPQANNFVQRTLEEEGLEVILPDLIDFLMYCLTNPKNKQSSFGGFRKSKFLSGIGIWYIETYRNFVRKALKDAGYDYPLRIEELEALASEVVSLNHQYGEGWLLTAEMIELIHSEAPNIVCVQPFGCLPNHLTGKGSIKAIREKYPQSNIIAIDYDPGASEVNQLNRIKLMISSAKKNFEKFDERKMAVNRG